MSSSSSPDFLAAASPSGKLMAVLVSSPHAAIRIGLLQTDGTAYHLQTTLTTASNASTTIESKQVQQLLFLDDNHLAALLNDRLVVWDLMRGVVAYTYQPPAALAKNDAHGSSTNSNSPTFLYSLTAHPADAGGGCSVLVAAANKGNDNHNDIHKRQIHQLDAHGKLVRKIKAGHDAVALCYLPHQHAYAILKTSPSNSSSTTQPPQIRILDQATGHKQHKVNLVPNNNSNSKKKKSHASSMATLDAPFLLCCLPHPADPTKHLLATVVGGTVVLVDPAHGTMVDTQPWTLPSAPRSLQAFGSFVLVNQTHVYQCDAVQQQVVVPTLQNVWHMDPSLERTTICTTTQKAWAILQATPTGPLQVQELHVTPNNDNNSKPTTIVYLEKKDTSTATAITNDNKRRAANILGPGQAGGEARQVSEGPGHNKRLKTTLNDDDNEQQQQEEGPSIAQRLEQLQQAMDDDDDDDDESMQDVDNKESSLFQPKKATTESLTEILQQALQSRNDSLLELALSVKDDTMMNMTCQALTDDDLILLLTAVTSRVASKPRRAEYLCQTWLMALLKTGRVRSRKHLQPLRNILQERTAVFQPLLHLDGKLSMLGSL